MHLGLLGQSLFLQPVSPFPERAAPTGPSEFPLVRCTKVRLVRRADRPLRCPSFPKEPGQSRQPEKSSALEECPFEIHQPSERNHSDCQCASQEDSEGAA